MKNFKKIAAMAAALTLAACSVAPMVVMNASAENHTITITSNDNANHTYVAYQIFSGDYVSDVLTNVAWGDGVDGVALLAALKEDDTLKEKFASATTAQDVADILGSTVATEVGGETQTTPVFGNDSELTKQFAKIVAANTKSSEKKSFANGSLTAADGYYIIMDESAPTGTTPNSGAMTRFILKLAGDKTIPLTAKSAAPTVDKQVQDDDAIGDASWSESADHEMYEKFNFKLTASLPASTEYANYQTYKVKFNDTMSKGVAFSKINSVTVDGVNVAANGYDLSARSTDPTTGVTTWNLTINDVKAISGVDLSNGADIVVEYEAYLTKDAIVSSATGENLNVNNNKVNLEYSNNPNASGNGEWEKGTTPDDYVWVFTYEAFNKKVNENNEALSGAEFKLYTDAECNNEYGLIYDGVLEVYRPITGDETATAMTSNTNGVFNIVGLDAGTYYLKETKAPDGGYNLLTEAKAIAITATHSENAEGTAANLTLIGNASSENPLEIENKKGTSLPSTGGIGTTLFYVGGGCMAGLAGLFLITKKRMGKKEN